MLVCETENPTQRSTFGSLQPPARQGGQCCGRCCCLRGRLLIVFLAIITGTFWGSDVLAQSTNLSTAVSEETQESAVQPGLVSDLSFSAENDRVLMLQNGAVFEGKIERIDDKWKVSLGSGATVIFPNYQVRVVADSIRDIYLFQTQKVSQFDVQQKTGLVRWCLQNNLIRESEQELEDLSRLRIDPSLKKSLKLQLDRLKSPESVNSSAVVTHSHLKTPSVQQPIVETPVADPAASSNPSPSSMADAPASLAVKSPRQLPVSTVFKVYDVPGMKNSQQVQTAIDNQLSNETLQNFAQTTHQTLVDSCGACHFQGNSQIPAGVDFELQISSNKTPLEAMRHNLRQVMKLLNRENPGNSELLTIASTAHGGMKKPPIAPASEMEQSLVTWVYSTQVDSGNPTELSKVMLAGAQSEDQKNTQVEQTFSPVGSRSKNSSNPYDPTAFNQQASSHRYELPTSNQPMSQELQSADAFQQVEFAEAMRFDAQGVPELAVRQAGQSLRPRPTSIFALQSPQSSSTGTSSTGPNFTSPILPAAAEPSEKSELPQLPPAVPIGSSNR